ncbi:MucR family transcriptional regulator [Methylobacterium sp. NEAU K]|uniref:MucR family transcriptional regulator n=1 Tax=Methylobacterium sp. NEAU K TaxID=3064946 RepID=UPI002736710A|nr:MucR family transcriptional regulator [Methylobacterium sp. NEAU K]MDP4006001.1 MucR family transcriptional regulator [Methylobacterium sp. NEAU K]
MEDSISLPQEEQVDFIELTADIVSAYVANNSVPAPELPTLLSGVHAALASLGQTSGPAEPDFKRPTPAQIRKSISPDALISFIDGKPYKTLKRHLTGNGLTIEQYRQRYGLPADYPTTAANYSAMRAEFARTAGLGHKRRKPVPKLTVIAETVAEEPASDGHGAAAEPLAKPARARKPRKAETKA